MEARYAARLQQTCKACGRPDKFDFHVPDDVWVAVVPEEFRCKVLCLGCFDRFAFLKDVDYAKFVEIVCFVGEQATFTFQVIQALGREFGGI